MLIAAAAAVQALAAGPAFAQNAAPPAPASNATDIGPAQLRDFTLNGTVTRPAETRDPQPRAEPPAPAAQPPRTQPSSTTELPPARSPAPSAAAPALTGRSTTVELPPAESSAVTPSAAGDPFAQAPVATPDLTMAPESDAIPEGSSILPWLFAAMLIGAGAAYYVFRVRPRAQTAGGSGVSELAAAPPPLAPAPEQRAPIPAPPAGGIVSTRLRPWLEVDFVPERTIVDNDRIILEFLVLLYNSGAAPARDVRVDAALINASPTQDRQISAFFAQPSGGGERVEVVAPLQRVTVRSSVTVSRAGIQPLLADGRPLLVPMTAVTALYHWGSNHIGQTSLSFLVGRKTDSEKLAPFRLDLGPRVFRGLAALEHQLRVRN